MNQTGILCLLAAVGCHAVVLLGFKLPPQNQTPRETVYLEVSLAASIPAKGRAVETQATPAPAVPAHEPSAATESDSVSPRPESHPVVPPERPVVSAPTPNVDPTPPPAEPKNIQPQPSHPAPLPTEAFATSVTSSAQNSQQQSAEVAAGTAKLINAAFAYETIERPYYVKRGQPEYPIEAKRLKQEGIVVLALFINEKGQLDKVEVVQSSGFPLLDRAAIAAERRSRFRPAHRGGHAIACKAEVPYRFVLP